MIMETLAFFIEVSFIGCYTWYILHMSNTMRVSRHDALADLDIDTPSVTPISPTITASLFDSESPNKSMDTSSMRLIMVFAKPSGLRLAALWRCKMASFSSLLTLPRISFTVRGIVMLGATSEGRDWTKPATYNGRSVRGVRRQNYLGLRNEADQRRPLSVSLFTSY